VFFLLIKRKRKELWRTEGRGGRRIGGKEGDREEGGREEIEIRELVGGREEGVQGEGRGVHQESNANAVN